jgi:hypothetical protein
MPPNTRPDAITRAEMPASAQGNPATPIIIGLIGVLIFFLLLLLFMGVIPFEVFKGGEKETKNLDAAINRSESQAMHNLNSTGSLYPAGPPVTPDPILSSLEAPYAAEEEKEERSEDS